MREGVYTGSLRGVFGLCSAVLGEPFSGWDPNMFIYLITHLHGREAHASSARWKTFQWASNFRFVRLKGKESEHCQRVFNDFLHQTLISKLWFPIVSALLKTKKHEKTHQNSWKALMNLTSGFWISREIPEVSFREQKKARTMCVLQNNSNVRLSRSLCTFTQLK